MKVEDLQNIALKLPAVTEDIKWQSHLCFNIGAKMFLVTSPDVIPSPVSFKVPEEIFYELISNDAFSRHTYLGRHHWVHVDDINRLTKKEWEHYIRQSYNLVASKLSLKFRKQIGLEYQRSNDQA